MGLVGGGIIQLKGTKMTIASKVIELAKWTIGGALLTGLVACGGGGGSVSTAPTAVANADVTAAVTAANIAALAPATGATPTAFTFNSGFSGTDASGNAVNLAGPTTVAITAAGATPTFTITNGGGTATGTVGFGSCDFTATASSISGWTVGGVVKVNPCSVTFQTTNVTTGIVSTVSVTLNLGGTLSATSTMPGVTISSTGTVTINGVTVGTVTVTTVTGAGA